MSVPQRFAGHLRLFRLVGRIAAIALVWILVVGIATVCFFPLDYQFPPAIQRIGPSSIMPLYSDLP